MTPVDALASLLLELQEKGSVPQSRLKGNTGARLRPLLDAGALREVRAGAGKAVQVVDRVSLQRFVAHHYPSGLVEEQASGESGDQRTRSVARYRDSKALGGLDFEIVEVRLVGRQPLLLGDRAIQGDTHPHRLACVVLHDARRDTYPTPRFAGHLATCENPTVFLSYPWSGDGIDLVVLTYGRMSRRLIEWLSSPPMEHMVATHYGDYDPVGLAEYLRLKKRLGDRASLYVPDNLDALFQRFGQRELLTRSARFRRPLAESGDPSVQHILGMMQSHGKGLEQEALIHSKSSEPSSPY